MTLQEYITLLQIKLNDQDDGQWSEAEKRVYIATAVKRTLVKTRSYISSVTIPIVAGTHTYNADPVFMPLAVRIGDDVIQGTPPESIRVIVENWDETSSGQPNKWMGVGGSYLRISPTPEYAGAGLIGTISSTFGVAGSGYAVGDILSLSAKVSDDSVPDELARVTVTSLLAGGAYGAELYGADDNQGVNRKYRGVGYTTTTYKTTAITGSGSGAVAQVTALASMIVYGPAYVDIDSEDDDLDIDQYINPAFDQAIIYAAKEEAFAARPTVYGGQLHLAEHALWLDECSHMMNALRIKP